VRLGIGGECSILLGLRSASRKHRRRRDNRLPSYRHVSIATAATVVFFPHIIKNFKFR
jgi:hypothetical protein